MRRAIALAAFGAGTVMGAATPALAQATDGEWQAYIAVTLAGSAMEADTPLAPAERLLGSAALVVTRSDTFDNGLTLGWRGEARLERDAPSRPAFAGVLGACPGTDPLCPRVAGGGAFLSPIAPATGLAAGGAAAGEDGFATIEAASASLAGPWGEGVLGLDSGVAARLDARAPTVLTRVSAFSPGLDPTGLGVTRARNDVTGSSFKAAYMSPRWVGFRAGVSFAPKAGQRSADFDPDFEGPGLGKAELENVWEGALSFARQFAEQDLRIRAAVTYSHADSGSGVTEFTAYEAWGAGLELEHDGWIGGVRWLSSNNAWKSNKADYEAWEAGLTRQIGEWRVGIEGGWAKDSLTGIEGASWLAGASYKINEKLDVGIAWSAADADLPALPGPGASHTNASNYGLVIELTVRN